jgi:hypothetical protein
MAWWRSMPDPKPCLAQFPGMHKSLILGDLLHILYLGVGQDFCASVLCLLAESALLPLGKEEALGTLYRHFEGWCLSHGYRPFLSELTPQKIGWAAKNFPELPGKGADCKWMIAFLGHYMPTLGCTQVGDELAVAEVASWALASWVALLDAQPMWLCDEAARTCGAFGDVFCRCYELLAHWANSGGRCHFKFRPKMHEFVHVLDRIKNQRSRLNPRFAQCFLDEDFIGRMAQLSRMPHQTQIGLRVVQRYLIMLESA